MPQASALLQTKMKEYFGGTGIDDAPVIEYLESQRYKLRHDFIWIKPKDHKPTEKELNCICFLIEEWDYGGITH